MDDERPLFIQLAELISSGILADIYQEGSAIPSINELAAFYTINPATANRAVNLLVAQEVIEKRRGIGMFVLPGAKEKLMAQRRSEFVTKYIQPAIAEAQSLGISTTEMIDLLRQEAERK